MSFPLRNLHPDLIPYADYSLSWAAYLGLHPRVTSVLRDSITQAELRFQYEQCLSAGQRVYPGNADPQCRYPANRPGDSAHEFGLAWDSVVPPGEMETWTAIRRAVGWRVPEGDLIHAELPDWRNYVIT